MGGQNIISKEASLHNSIIFDHNALFPFAVEKFLINVPVLFMCILHSIFR